LDFGMRISEGAAEDKSQEALVSPEQDLGMTHSQIVSAE